MSEFSENILKGLNPQQKEAVEYVNGPLLVIAGAGSGKTRVLTSRVAYLIDQGIPPDNILAVTFTNKAANEMKTRVEKLVGGNYGSRQPLIGTFHAVCLRFLRAHIHLLGYENTFVIYDTADQEALMKQVMKDLSINPKQHAPRAVLSKISQAKNHLITSSEFAGKAHNQFMIVAGNCYKEYQKRLKQAQALDFDDIIMKTIILFRNHPEILQIYQDRYQYIMIDEYQDTNYAQHALVNQLSEKYKNLMVVGDADQSIYGFRGANMSNILDFQKGFPGTKMVKLEVNYRSTGNILNAAHHIIVKNQNRHDKRMRTNREEGDLVEVKELRSSRDEAMEVAKKIADIKRSSLELSYKDFAVLYRTNAQSRIMEEAFMRYGIPYKIIGGVKFYSRKEIKDILSYLRVILNHHDIVSLLRIINTPTRKIGAKTIEILTEASNQLGMSLYDTMSACDGISELSDSKKASVRSFIELIDHLKEKAKEYNVAGLIKYLLIETGYKEFLFENSEVEKGEGRAKARLGDGQTRLENVYELTAVASKYNVLEPMISLSTFLEEVSLIAEVDNLKDSDNAVVLMTIHSAKGLEFPHVFLTGLEEGLFPHFNSLTSPEELEEERRLLYVAITRAEENLYFSFAKMRMTYGESRQCRPSQFLKDIPEEYLSGDVGKIYGYAEGASLLGFHGSSSEYELPTYSDGRKVTPLTQRSFNIGGGSSNIAEADVSVHLEVGDRIQHKLWGDGMVTEVRGGIVDIKFNDIKIGTKKLALNIAPIVKIG